MIQSAGLSFPIDGQSHLIRASILTPFSSVQLLSRVWLFATPWTAARQASLSITNSQSLLKLMFIELVMPSNQFILCHPLLLSPSVFPSIRVFSNESVLRIRWLHLLLPPCRIPRTEEPGGLQSTESQRVGHDWETSLTSLGLEWKLSFSSSVAIAEFSKCSTFTESSFRIWNSSHGIPSPPLALFVEMLPKAHLT